MQNSEKIWHRPWRYLESAIVVMALVVGGFLLQLIAGPFNFYILHQPVNYVIAGLILLAAALSVPWQHKAVIRWLGSVYLAVPLIFALLVFGLVMGLIPQHPHLPAGMDNPVFSLGFIQVTSSWPFIIIYGLTLLSLALTTARRLKPFSRRNVIFFLNHAGLWLVLAAAGLGAADKERYTMYVREGEMEWRVYSENKSVLELPLAIHLIDFDMEEYPPKLAIINRQSGTPLPTEVRPALHQIDPDQSRSQLLDWDITVEEFIARAVPSGDGAYTELPMPASTPAAKVMAKNRLTGSMKMGWVAGGNISLPVSPLVLDEETVLVMTQAEPRRFTSHVKVFTEEGQSLESVVEVNKPLRAGHWLIYQYGYDNQAGRMSSYSSFELIYDPGVWVVYAGLLFWALGSLGLILYARERRQIPSSLKGAEK